MRNFLRRMIGEERGIALVVALMTMTVLTVAGTATIYYAESNQHQAGFSRGNDVAYRLAEAGLNNAVAVLGGANTNAVQQSALGSSEAAATTKAYTEGTAKWWGVYDSTTKSWTIYGKGFVTNPAATASSITRTVSASIQVTTSLTSTLNTTAWDYIMSKATGTVGGCDMTISNGGNTGNPATVNTRLYVMGNLCLGTSQGGIANIATGPLMVKGSIKVNQASSSVGYSNAKINEAHVGAGCSKLGSALRNPCKDGFDNIYATAVDNVVPNVTAPVADFASWYTNARPGPTSGCTTTNTGPTPTFDSNATRDNSVATVFNLTPATSYTCVNGPAASPDGKLTWDATNKLLTIVGTIYIDGSMAITNGAMNQYNGQGTIYLSGTFKMTAGSKMCGAKDNANPPNCDFAGWNPNTELLAIVADGVAGQDPATVGIWLYDSQYQGAFYATNKIRPEGITRTDGPMVGSEVEVGYNVSTAAAVSNGFPVITTVPVGLPGAPNAHAQPSPPTGYSG